MEDMDKIKKKYFDIKQVLTLFQVLVITNLLALNANRGFKSWSFLEWDLKLQMKEKLAAKTQTSLTDSNHSVDITINSVNFISQNILDSSEKII